MLPPLFAVFLIFATVSQARKSPKIQIFEILDRGNNGIELRDLGFNPNSRLKAESKLLNLIQSKRQKNTQNYVTEQLIEEYNNLKGDEGNKISDDAYIHVLSNSFEDSDSTGKEYFLDNTQNNRAVEQSLQKILETL